MQISSRPSIRSDHREIFIGFCLTTLFIGLAQNCQRKVSRCSRTVFKLLSKKNFKIEKICQAYSLIAALKPQDFLKSKTITISMIEQLQGLNNYTDKTIVQWCVRRYNFETRCAFELSEKMMN